MAPTRPKSKKNGARKADKRAALLAKKAGSDAQIVNPRQLLADATFKLQQGDPEGAAKIAKTAFEQIGPDGRHSGACLTLLGQIHVELGEIDQARGYFLQAIETDEDDAMPDEISGGPERFLWLAQLSEEGGQDSVTWFERGATALRKQIQSLTDGMANLPQTRDLQEAVIREKKNKLGETLCAVAEVYMTDLSWEEDAEQRCEALITEAGLVAPDMPETWQTVANVRISQSRLEDARAALDRSLNLWKDLPPDDQAIPPFPTRVSLLRLLVEVGKEETAYEVADRMIQEDDTSVEVAYLGGFAMHNLGETGRTQEPGDEETWKAAWRSSRRWLSNCLRLFEAQGYEDEQLGEHAKELLELISTELGEGSEDDGDWEDTDGGEDEDEDGDEEME
ncbi:hypothetical protein GQ53DRAFT_748208 [Thozetella sp. PMI_491]|nr:hypothetical protein GQ53DRAFT_748208 [Thozetella sp. PMI_491]